jgi:hypothetical protein
MGLPHSNMELEQVKNLHSNVCCRDVSGPNNSYTVGLPGPHHITHLMRRLHTLCLPLFFLIILTDPSSLSWRKANGGLGTVTQDSNLSYWETEIGRIKG